MKGKIITPLRIFLILSILLGIVYPLVILSIGQIVMSDKANGSLILSDQKIVGSKLIGQSFTSDKYFHSRPSAVNYDASHSGGSNLGPSSIKLITLVEKQITSLRSNENLDPQIPIPADMALQSASGLDPHISVQNALIQVPRILKARNLSENTVLDLLEKNMDRDLLGIWGQTAVNVLKLNSALDAQK